MQAFGGAVDLHEDIAESLLGLAQFRRAHRCGTVGHGLQRGQVVVPGFGQFQQTVDHGRHQQGHGGLFCFDVAAQLRQVRDVLGQGATTTEQGWQQPQAGAVADRRHVQETGVRLVRLFSLQVHRIAQRHPVVDGVGGAFALAGGATGEAIDQRVLLHVVVDAGVVIRDAFKQVPEIPQTLARGGGRVHADNLDALAMQQVEIAIDQGVLDKHHFRPQKLHLPAMLFEGVAIVGVGCRCITFERGPGMEQRDIVVFQNAQVDIPAA
ncbi:hypothetical protein D3C78_981790 [compost metagenome]